MKPSLDGSADYVVYQEADYANQVMTEPKFTAEQVCTHLTLIDEEKSIIYPP